MNKKIKNIFVEGPITPSSIAKSIENHQTKSMIGAHNIFLGQVTADIIGKKKIIAIEYSAQIEISNQLCHEIREAAFLKYDLTCMHIYHSIGKVKAGEICFFVFVSSSHRSPVFQSLEKIVNEIKDRLPIFGKEIFDDKTYQWKVNN